MKLGIIIVSYKTCAYTVACLGSIYAHPPADSFEVIVVDNNSGDGTVEEIARIYPQCRIVALPNNVGFSEANNLAFGLTKAEVILLLNPDTLICAGLFDTLLGCLAADYTIGAVGPLQLRPDLTPWRYETWAIGPLTYLLQPLLLRWVNTTGTKDVPWLCGACIAMPRHVRERVGKLDVEMFGEDIDFCARIRALGYRLKHCAEARMVHYWGTSAATPTSARRRVLVGRKSKIYYHIKHHGLIAGWLMSWSIGVECLVRIVLAACAARNAPEVDRERVAAFKELLHGILSLRFLREAKTTMATRFGAVPGWWRGITG